MSRDCEWAHEWTNNNYSCNNIFTGVMYMQQKCPTVHLVCQQIWTVEHLRHSALSKISKFLCCMMGNSGSHTVLFHWLGSLSSSFKPSLTPSTLSTSNNHFPQIPLQIPFLLNPSTQLRHCFCFHEPCATKVPCFMTAPPSGWDFGESRMLQLFSEKNLQKWWPHIKICAWCRPVEGTFKS